MTKSVQPPQAGDLRPRLTVIGVGGAGCNAINNMISAGLSGVNFVVANTDAQALAASSAEHRIQLGVSLTEGLGAGSKPEIGQAAAEEPIADIRDMIAGSHMVFVAAGMGGGTGTGAAAVISRIARELGILTVGVVTKPFQFEGARRMRTAEEGIIRLRENVDTLIVIPNQNLFRIANDKTTFAEAFILADQVLYSGVACIVDLIVKEGLINLDFADVRTIMSGMGTAMMGTGEASGPGRATAAAEEAISNPLLDDVTLKGAKGLLLSITGGNTLTLFEVDEAASRVRLEVDPEANVIVGATFDQSLGDRLRVSIVASGMARMTSETRQPYEERRPAVHSQAPTMPVASTEPPPLPAFAPTQAPVSTFEERPSEGFTRQLPSAQADSDVHRRLTDALASEPETTFQQIAPAPEPVQSAAPYVPPDMPPPLPSPRTWIAPGQVVIEEQPETQPYVVSERAQYRPHGPEVQPASIEPAFSPMPPAEFRRQRRMPEVEDFPVVGQRDYMSKKPGARSGPPPFVAPAAPPVAEAPQKSKGWFSRFAGRSSDASDSHDVAAQQRTQRPAGAGQSSGWSRGSAPAASDSTPGTGSKVRETPDLPGFIGSRRK